MFGFGRKNRWADPGAPKQFGDGEKVWAEGPAKGKFVDPEETGPTIYDELVAQAESSPESPRFKPEPQVENHLYDIQDQLTNQVKREWAQKVKSKEKKPSRQENEKHNPYKGGAKIGSTLADNDNAEDTSKREKDIIRSIDEMAA